MVLNTKQQDKDKTLKENQYKHYYNFFLGTHRNETIRPVQKNVGTNTRIVRPLVCVCVVVCVCVCVCVCMCVN